MQEFHLQVVSHNIYESLLGGGVQLSLIPVNLGALSLKVPRLLSLKVLLKLYHLSLIPKSISTVIPYPSNNMSSYPVSLKLLTGPHLPSGGSSI